MAIDKSAGITTHDENAAVQSGTRVVNNRDRAEQLSRMRANVPETEEEAPAAPGEEGVEEAAQADQEGEPQEGEQQAASPEDEQADALLRLFDKALQRRETRDQAETQGVETPQQLTKEAEIEQQREKVQEEAQTQFQTLEQEEQKVAESKQNLLSQLEKGDLDFEKYATENEKLNAQKEQLREQKYGIRENMNHQLLTLDQEMKLMEREKNQALRQRKEQFVQSHPEFIDFYNSDEGQKFIADNKDLYPNPAAAFKAYQSEQLQQQLNTVQQELAQLKNTQDQAVARGAEGTKKVAKQAGTNQYKPAPAGGQGDGMMAALEAFRAQQSGTA